MPKPKKVVKRSISKATSRTGSGTKRGGGRTGSGGAITIASVSPRGSVGNPAPTVRAKVEAEGANLSKSDMRLYLDGAEQRRFYYGKATGNLSYHPGMLSSDSHTVEIVATTGQGPALQACLQSAFGCRGPLLVSSIHNVVPNGSRTTAHFPIGMSKGWATTVHPLCRRTPTEQSTSSTR